ncbi:MAG: hypothetical protein LBF12_04135 [Christensenellaceae bacterium]|jgi:hypothetical protein|nr:hypothetical protein [Christensenellaceae bacterium]
MIKVKKKKVNLKITSQADLDALVSGAVGTLEIDVPDGKITIPDKGELDLTEYKIEVWGNTELEINTEVEE